MNVQIISNVKERRWCFTLNNYTAEEVESIKNASCRFLVFGKEICPTTGTPHLQGYVEFASQTRLGGVKRALGTNRLNLRTADGDAQANIVYCTKEDDDFFQKGTCVTQGMRTDVTHYVRAIQSGMVFNDILEHFPEEYCKFHSAYDRIRCATMTDRDGPMEVLWYYGPTGTGKSHSAHTLGAQEGEVYVKQPGKWWCGYEGQHTVICDEFRADWFTFYYLLLLTDKWPMLVEVKNGQRKFCSKRIIFTAPCKWDEMFRGQTEEKLDQLKRRITETRYFPNRYYAPPPALQVIDQGHPEAEPDDLEHLQDIHQWAHGFDHDVQHRYDPMGLGADIESNDAIMREDEAMDWDWLMNEN